MTRQKAMGKIRKFVGRYDRILGFVGFLTVFATFVVKDAFREQLKELAASIDSAEHTFVLRQDSSALRSQLAAVQVTLDLVRSGIKQQQAHNFHGPEGTLGPSRANSAGPATGGCEEVRSFG